MARTSSKAKTRARVRNANTLYRILNRYQFFVGGILGLILFIFTFQSSVIFTFDLIRTCIKNLGDDGKKIRLHTHRRDVVFHPWLSLGTFATAEIKKGSLVEICPFTYITNVTTPVRDYVFQHGNDSTYRIRAFVSNFFDSCYFQF